VVQRLRGSKSEKQWSEDCEALAAENSGPKTAKLRECEQGGPAVHNARRAPFVRENQN